MDLAEKRPQRQTQEIPLQFRYQGIARQEHPDSHKNAWPVAQRITKLDTVTRRETFMLEITVAFSQKK